MTDHVFFLFPDLLSEMQGEVVSHLAWRERRALLATGWLGHRLVCRTGTRNPFALPPFANAIAIDLRQTWRLLGHNVISRKDAQDTLYQLISTSPLARWDLDDVNPLKDAALSSRALFYANPIQPGRPLELGITFIDPTTKSLVQVTSCLESNDPYLTIKFGTEVHHYSRFEGAYIGFVWAITTTTTISSDDAQPGTSVTKHTSGPNKLWDAYYDIMSNAIKK
jgi:hypothetical protein